MARSDDIRNQAEAKEREAESALAKVQEFDEMIRKATQDREFYQQQYNSLKDEVSRLRASADQEAENERQQDEKKRLETAAMIAAHNATRENQ